MDAEDAGALSGENYCEASCSFGLPVHKWTRDGQAWLPSYGYTAYYFVCHCGKIKTVVCYTEFMKRRGAVDFEEIS
ncbi:hypothetical protein [Oerskovia merdavium]|uniref:Uncharacterized protein n=1 Tax=Oerskovia merdavium TaxID=2762227 RepID=A0ABR8U2P1_9CELL|nr:hypothetical protein [Oerskovia merdavium]MBD7982295.1 hypothetical protein [Oerskovia merdavium]